MGDKPLRLAVRALAQTDFMQQLCSPLLPSSRLLRSLGGACLALGLMAGALTAQADDMSPVLGGGVGAAAGAILGESMGGSTGAMVGGALGGAAGAAVGSKGHDKNAAIIGGAVGGGAGAVLGNSVGGKAGAAVGAGVGGAAGVAVGKKLATNSNSQSPQAQGGKPKTKQQLAQGRGHRKHDKHHKHS